MIACKINKEGIMQNTQKFFSKTESLLDNLSALSIFDKESLQKGMKFDLLSQNDGKDCIFFELYVGALRHLAVAYSYIFEEREFAKGNAPRLHFIKCEQFLQLKSQNVKICVPSVNAFDYRVRVNGVDTRLFYEHPLHICETCMSIFHKILAKKFQNNAPILKEQEILNLIIRNKLKNIVF